MCLSPIVDALVSLVPQKARESEVRMLYLGTASYDKVEAFHAQTHVYQQMKNFVVTKLDVSEAVDKIPSEEEIREAIMSAHIIMASGGNTLYAVTRWKALKIDQMIQEAIVAKQGELILCGGSAGSIIWHACGHSDSMNPTTFLHVDPNLTEEEKNAWEYIRVSGLGFIPAMCVPHHEITLNNGRPRADDSDLMLLRYPEMPAIGLEEAAAIVVVNGSARLVSGDGVAKCFIKVVEHNSVQRTPFTQDHGIVSFDRLLQGRVEEPWYVIDKENLVAVANHCNDQVALEQ